MARPHDTQRSRVYQWERRCARIDGRDFYSSEFDTGEEASAWLAPIWRAERGRMGRARQAMPEVLRASWGQRSALAHQSRHAISLPRWARSRWVILHEAAHILNDAGEPAHGPRFVGLLMGLAARWLDADACELMRVADELGVKYHVRTIGVVPSHGVAWYVERALRQHGAMTPMDTACVLSILYGAAITERQVRGAAVSLIRSGRVRLLRHNPGSDSRAIGQSEHGCTCCTSLSRASALEMRRRRVTSATPARKPVASALGGATPDEYVQLAHSDAVVDCHVLRGPQCAGVAIYRRNVCKRTDAPNLSLPGDTQAVFATPLEFLAHHRSRPGRKP